MNIIHVSYDADSGWALVTEAGLEARRNLPGAWACKHVVMVEGSASIRIVVTGLHPRMVNEIGKRAMSWLVESGHARRDRGALVLVKAVV